MVGDGIYATHPLPETGDLTIGRSDKADVCIDDPLAVDPERSPLITKLFELYATGQYTGPQAHEYITAAGLRTRGSKRHPGGTPISMGQVYEILASRYYLGSSTTAATPL